MAYIYTPIIKDLKGKENNNLIAVIRYIAQKEHYMFAGNIMYKKLYKELFRRRLSRIFHEKHITGFPSRAQLKNLICSKDGKTPKFAAVYLWVIYERLDSYKERIDIDITKHEHERYTYFVANLIRKYFEAIIRDYVKTHEGVTPTEFVDLKNTLKMLDKLDDEIDKTVEQIFYHI